MLIHNSCSSHRTNHGAQVSSISPFNNDPNNKQKYFKSHTISNLRNILTLFILILLSVLRAKSITSKSCFMVCQFIFKFPLQVYKTLPLNLTVLIMQKQYIFYNKNRNNWSLFIFTILFFFFCNTILHFILRSIISVLLIPSKWQDMMKSPLSNMCIAQTHYSFTHFSETVI